MAKFKINDSIWSVLGESFKIYFKNIGKFTKYMLFPVFGQVIGIILIFGLTAWFGVALPNLVQHWHILNSLESIIFMIILLTIPGFIIFFKAFWDFLVAYGAINSMTEALVTTGKLYDLKAHKEVITRQSYKYIGFLLVISIMFLIGINPLFWVLGMIFFVYFVLVFQIFTFEQDLSIFDIFKRSLSLIKGNFARTFVIMVILYLISYYALSFCTTIFFEFIRFAEILKSIFEAWAITLPLNEMNDFLLSFRLPAITALNVANFIFSSSITFIVAGLTLPMRSVTWSIWYKNLAAVKAVPNKKEKVK